MVLNLSFECVVLSLLCWVINIVLKFCHDIQKGYIFDYIYRTVFSVIRKVYV